MKTLLTHLFFAFCIIILSGCENENNDNSAIKSYTVLEAIEGTWDACVTYDNECKEIGKLTIQGSVYQFSPVKNIENMRNTSGLRKLDFLYDAPFGKVQIEYRGNIKPSNSFESYSENDILAKISFISEQQEIKRGFFIRVNEKNKSLYLHSLVSEISQWRVTKEL